MRAKWPLLATMLSLGVAYVAYPYVTLYRLGSAIQGADVRTLESLVDWPAVREGIKEDVCDLAIDDPGAKSGAELPPFGASFVRGIASSAIDQAVTPKALLAATATVILPATRPSPPGDLVHAPRGDAVSAPRGTDMPAPRGAGVHVNWAFFDSPTTFLVSLLAGSQAVPIKLEMELRQGEWRVRRVWLPAELLSSGSPT